MQKLATISEAVKNHTQEVKLETVYQTAAEVVGGELKKQKNYSAETGWVTEEKQLRKIFFQEKFTYKVKLMKTNSESQFDSVVIFYFRIAG